MAHLRGLPKLMSARCRWMDGNAEGGGHVHNTENNVTCYSIMGIVRDDHE